MTPAVDTELIARLEALPAERRAAVLEHVAVRYAPELRHMLASAVRPIEFDEDSRTVTIEGRTTTLPRSGFELLKVLASDPGHCFSREELTQRLWESPYVGTRVVDVQITRLRRLIEPDPQRPCIVVTTWGSGWRLAL